MKLKYYYVYYSTEAKLDIDYIALIYAYISMLINILLIS